jgi:UPF0755 protein
MREEMNLNKVVFRFVSISFSILVILLVLIGFVKIGTYCYDFGYRVDAEPGRDVVVQISDDMSDMDIAKELKEKGLVENAKLFFVQLKVSAYSGRLHSGVYTLNTSMTTRDMMVLMAAEPEQSSTDDTETVTGTTEETTEETTDTQTDADTVTGEE